jgi:hypothetical protein
MSGSAAASLSRLGHDARVTPSKGGLFEVGLIPARLASVDTQNRPSVDT